MLVMLSLVVSCAKEEPLADEELEAELSALSPEELEAVTAEDSGAFAGMAKANPNLLRLQRSYRRAVTTGPAPPTCSDTDADAANPTGLDEFEKGTLTWSGGSMPYEDVCGDEKLLRENYCSSVPNGLRLTKSVDCSDYNQKLGGTWKCMDGACKKQEPADLVVDSAGFKEFVNASGKYANITAKVKNIGLGSTGGDFHTVFKGPGLDQYRSSLTLASGAEVTLSEVHVGPCPQNLEVVVTADNSTVAAYQDKIAESDETNNGKQMSVTC